QLDRKKSILRAVVGKNICERRRDHGAKTKVGQSPYRMLARRSAAEIPARDQNACTFVPRLIQNEIRILLPVGTKPPVVKHKLPKAGAFDALEKLLGNDLVGIHVDSVERRDVATVCPKRIHRALLVISASASWNFQLRISVKCPAIAAAAAIIALTT